MSFQCLNAVAVLCTDTQASLHGLIHCPADGTCWCMPQGSGDDPSPEGSKPLPNYYLPHQCWSIEGTPASTGDGISQDSADLTPNFTHEADDQEADLE